MSEPKPDHAGIFVPPPLIYVAGIAGGWGLQMIWPLPRPPVGLSLILGWVFVAGWAITALPGLGAFARARTSMIPVHESRVLVQNGVYRFTRNPMYLGLSLLYIATGLMWRQPWILLLTVPVVLLIDRWVIAWEERYLDRRFGDEYRAYRARVRRWI